MDDIRFSLIMATLGRTEEVKAFFDSLIVQSYGNYEIIVVDQNSDYFIKDLCEEYMDVMSIKYIHSKEKGLSKARNKGLKVAEGNVIAFPDDDCEYESDILVKVAELFQDNKKYNIISFKSIDKASRKDSNNKWLSYNCDINFNNIFKTCISYTVFIKPLKKGDIVFDESLGVGAKFGSGEESDMLFTLFHKGYKGMYISSLYAYHPIKEEVKSRYYNYALGLGALMKKEIIHRKNYSYFLEAFRYILIRPLGGMIASLIKLDFENMNRYFLVLKGRIAGFAKFHIDKGKV